MKKLFGLIKEVLIIGWFPIFLMTTLIVAMMGVYYDSITVMVWTPIIFVLGASLY